MPRKKIYIYPIYSFWKQNKHETTISTFAPIHSWDSRSCDSWTLQARPFLTSPHDFPTFCKSLHTPTEAIRVRGQAFCPRRCPFGHGGTLVPPHFSIETHGDLGISQCWKPPALDVCYFWKRNRMKHICHISGQIIIIHKPEIRPFGMIPLINHDSRVWSQWGRYNLPR